MTGPASAETSSLRRHPVPVSHEVSGALMIVLGKFESRGIKLPEAEVVRLIIRDFERWRRDLEDSIGREKASEQVADRLRGYAPPVSQPRGSEDSSTSFTHTLFESGILVNAQSIAVWHGDTITQKAIISGIVRDFCFPLREQSEDLALLQAAAERLNRAAAPFPEEVENSYGTLQPPRCPNIMVP